MRLAGVTACALLCGLAMGHLGVVPKLSPNPARLLIRQSCDVGEVTCGPGCCDRGHYCTADGACCAVRHFPFPSLNLRSHHSPDTDNKQTGKTCRDYCIPGEVKCNTG